LHDVLPFAWVSNTRGISVRVRPIHELVVSSSFQRLGRAVHPALGLNGSGDRARYLMRDSHAVAAPESPLIHLPLFCSSRWGASGRHLCRILAGRGRVGLAHLILRNRGADGGANTGVCRPARMGLVGRDGVPKITLREQGLFRVQRSSDRFAYVRVPVTG